MQVVKIQLVFVLVLTSQNEAIMHIDTIAANVDTNDGLAGNDASTDIPDKDLSVPTARDHKVGVILDVFSADDSVGMTREPGAAADHGVLKLSCLLVISTDATIVTCSQEVCSLRMVVTGEERLACRFGFSYIEDLA